MLARREAETSSGAAVERVHHEVLVFEEDEEVERGVSLAADAHLRVECSAEAQEVGLRERIVERIESRDELPTLRPPRRPSIKPQLVEERVHVLRLVKEDIALLKIDRRRLFAECAKPDLGERHEDALPGREMLAAPLLHL